MRNPCSLLLTVAFLLGAAPSAFALEHLVATGKELRAAAGIAQPGDTILLAEGNWLDERLELELSWTAGAPITIRPQSRGKTVFSGRSSLEIKGAHVLLDGLVFADGHLEKGHVLRVRGAHCRVTRCTVRDYNPPEPTTRYHWLSLHGHHHRVDHCQLSGQNHSGVSLVVWLEGEGEIGSHRIDHNLLGPRTRGVDNGFETLRIGTSEYSAKDANCTVAHNLFAGCDGENEMISNKSSGNRYLANTFVGNSGCLTLRHGDRCLVAYNLLLGAGKRGSGGIRVIGEGHRILGNHIEGTDGRDDGAIALSAGVPDSGSNQYLQVCDILIAENRLFGNKGADFNLAHGLGSSRRTLLPERVRIEDNVLYGTSEAELRAADTQGIATWSGNEDLKATHALDLGDGEAFHPDPRVPAYHQLTKADVGPDSRILPHPEARPNSHPPGEVDEPANLAYIIPHPRSAPGDLVLDETEAELVGDWQYSTHTPPYVGIGYLHDQKSGKGEKSVAYRFKAPRTGRYSVEISHCSNVRRATNTPVTIHHAGGEETVRVNQQEIPEGRGRLFRPLGTFAFLKGEEGWVRISNDGTEPDKVVIADAVRLVWVE